MRRLALALLFAVVGVQCAYSAADARHVVRTTAQRRTMVELREGWPLSRPARSVLVHAPRSEVSASTAPFLPAASFGGAVVSAAATPSRDLVAWEDGETLSRGEDWTQFTLAADAQGKHMMLEIPAGKVQFDWAELVFDKGETQVVDFGERTCAPGLYSMADFGEGRKLDHVRIVARSRTGEAKVTLRMFKQ